MLSEQLKTYLIEFLVGVEVDAQTVRAGCITDRQLARANLIGYTRNPREMTRYKLVIYPSDFFDFGVYGTEQAQPILPLQDWRGIPLLFGEAREEWINEGKTLVVYADVLASTYYLTSRYEEMYRRGERDQHGRFPGKSSLPYRAGFIHRPIVDEYGEVLRAILLEHDMLSSRGLSLCARPPFFSKINLTHDVDQPYLYRGVWSYLRAVLKDGRNPFTAFGLCFGHPKNDEFNTFSKFIAWNKQLIRRTPEGMTDMIFFLKTPADHKLDKPNYRLRRPYMRTLLAQMRRAGARLGLHCSYASGLMPQLIAEQRQYLQKQLGMTIHKSRHHFLALREPEDMLLLYSAGIRHDYTMGYADVAGFRLGTCRPVKFINPNTRSLTELVLHPLTMMDVTLSRQDYMGLSLQEAESYAEGLIRQVASYNGELNLLWHNEQFSPTVHSWQTSLYRYLLGVIEDIEHEDLQRRDPEAVELAKHLSSCGGTEIHL